MRLKNTRFRRQNFRTKTNPEEVSSEQETMNEFLEVRMETTADEITTECDRDLHNLSVKTPNIRINPRICRAKKPDRLQPISTQLMKLSEVFD